MPSWMLKLVKPFIKKRIEVLLNDKAFEKKILDNINSKVDVPKLDETTEYAILETIYDAAVASIKLAIDEL